MGIKTGTVTFHRSYNFGAALQAYALQRFQQLHGYDNEIIDFICDYDSRKYKIFRVHLYRQSLNYLVSDLLFAAKNIMRKYAFHRFRKKYLSMTPKRYRSPGEDKNLIEGFDALICGSDQIWNKEITGALVPESFLDFAGDSGKMKIAYGPSTGNPEIQEEDRAAFARLLGNLDSISVRERTAAASLETLSGKTVAVVLDPVLLLEAGEYDKIIRQVPVRGAFLFFYELEQNPEMLPFAAKLAQEEGLTIIYYSKKSNPAIRQGINIYRQGPCEFLYYLKNARYIVTNSFHATVFSILFGRQFITFPTKKGRLRMVDVLHTLCLDDRLYSENADIHRPIDYSETEKRLEHERNASINYLLEQLKKAEERSSRRQTVHST